jgi:hypothetical protein
MAQRCLEFFSDWALPPPVALAAGDVEPVRVFDTAEAALAFLALNQCRALLTLNSRDIRA